MFKCVYIMLWMLDSDEWCEYYYTFMCVDERERERVNEIDSDLNIF